MVFLFLTLFMGLSLNSRENNTEDFYFGVTFCGNTTAEAKLLIDKVKGYSNLFVVDSGPVSKNETMLDEICNYAIGSGLNLLVYFGRFDLSWQLPWLNAAKQQWNDKFQGVYFFDEPAGSLLDGGNSSYIASNCPENCDDVTNLFVNAWRTMPELPWVRSLKNRSLLFTSDYALYWFDYLAGYDVVFAQFGWNHSRAQDIALIRGAAKVQNKTWGVIITWTYDIPPYLESGERLFDDMILAYQNGAKYISVFNYPKINDYGILEEEHFQAMEQFWSRITNKSNCTPKGAQNVLILPRNYGWGMRSPSDTIWGLWGPDDKSPQIWNISRILMARYGTRLDIVYDDAEFSLKDKYSNIYYWNLTVT